MTWTAVDPRQHLGGQIPEPFGPPAARFLYPGRTNVLYGPSETYKTWIALWCAAWVMQVARGDVAYIDFEDTPTGAYSRLDTLDVPRQTVIDRFRYFNPDTPVTTDSIDAVLDNGPKLIILDGLTEAMAMHSLDTDKDGAVGRWRSIFESRITRPTKNCPAGAALLTIDHTGLSDQTRQRGSGHKKGATMGTGVVTQRMRTMTLDTVSIVLTVTKDRNGLVPVTHPATRHLATIHFTTTEDGLRITTSGAGMDLTKLENPRILNRPERPPLQPRPRRSTAIIDVGELVEAIASSGGGITSREIGEALAVDNDRTLNRHLNAAIAAGHIYRTADRPPRYILPSESSTT